MAHEQLGEFFVDQDRQVEVPLFNVPVKLAPIMGRHYHLDPIRTVARAKRLVLLLSEGAQRSEIEHPLALKGGAHGGHLTDEGLARRGR